MLQSSKLILNQSCQDGKNFEVNKNAKHPYNQTVRLVSTFGSGSCVSGFGSSPKVETAAVSSLGLTQKWKLRTRFQFWAVSTFGPAQKFLLPSCSCLCVTSENIVSTTESALIGCQ